MSSVSAAEPAKLPVSCRRPPMPGSCISACLKNPEQRHPHIHQPRRLPLERGENRRLDSAFSHPNGEPPNIERFPAVRFECLDVAPQIAQSAGPFASAHLRSVNRSGRHCQCINAPASLGAGSQQPPTRCCPLPGAAGNRLFPNRRHPALGSERIIGSRSKAETRPRA